MIPIYFPILVLIAQSFVLETVVPTTANDFMLDELGNYFFIRKTSVEKQNATGGATFRTSELNYGNIEYLDVTNPLKPFIYYKDINKMVVLDNTLSQQGDVIDLFAVGYEQVEMVAGSRGDAYWLWDARNSELVRVDQNFKKLTSTGNLSVLLGKQINPAQLLERGNQLYMRDTLNGVFVFDVYGTYRTALNIKTKQDIQVMNNTIIYHDEKEVHLLSNDWITEETITLPESTKGRVFFFNQKLYFFTKNGLGVWRQQETEGGK